MTHAADIATAQAHPVVRFRNVSHTYTVRKHPDVTALKDVSFDILPGAVTAIVGPNGSGKTTVFKLINGLLPVQQGSVSVAGHDVTERRKIQNEVGVVFQSPSLDEQLRVRENISHYGMLYGLKLDKGLESNPVIKMLNIADVLDKKVETLSGGYQRRVELAKVLLTEPKTIILDEPFSGLDADAREKFFSTLLMLSRERGLNVILITHMLHIAARCDDVIVLDSGEVLAHDAPAKLTSSLGDAVIEIHSMKLDAVLHNVAQLGGIHTQQISGTTVLLTGAKLDAVLESLNGTVSTIQGIESRKPSLEDYFQSKTGKRYDTGVGGEGSAE